MLLSIGGNDIGWSQSVTACLGGTDAQCAGAAARHGFDFVDVTDRFVGYGVNAPEPWLLGAFEPGAFHPNLAGYEAYASAVTAAIQPGHSS